MGCDIHTVAEVRQGDKWTTVQKEVFPLDTVWQSIDGCTHTSEPFGQRNYGVFGFLANVRNYSHVPPLTEPRGIPQDADSVTRQQYEDWSCDAHSASHITLRELCEFDYGQRFWDRRVTKQTGPNSWNGAALAEEGEGEHPTFREFLGEQFFTDLEVLKSLGAPDDVRVVFWFDN